MHGTLVELELGMSAIGLVFTFVVSWWLLLFMVLPGVGGRTTIPCRAAAERTGQLVALKFLVTTVLATVLTLIVAIVAQTGLVQFRPPPSG